MESSFSRVSTGMQGGDRRAELPRLLSAWSPAAGEMLVGHCITRVWRHQAIFGSASSISKKLNQQAPRHLELASDLSPCGHSQADLTALGIPEQSRTVGSD